LVLLVVFRLLIQYSIGSSFFVGFSIGSSSFFGEFSSVFGWVSYKFFVFFGGFLRRFSVGSFGNVSVGFLWVLSVNSSFFGR
jgi:hypothetical protein